MGQKLIYKIQIQGQVWKCFLLEDDEMEKKFGGGIAGLCDHKRYQIFFAEGELDLETVIHELCHAYYSHMCVNSAGLSNDQMEEIFCEMFAKQSRNVLKKLRE